MKLTTEIAKINTVENNQDLQRAQIRQELGRYTNIIDGHNRRWIDRSIPILSIDTIGHADHRDSIDPPVKDFFFLIDSIDHRSQNPCQTDDHRYIGSLSTDGIDPSVKNRFSYHIL